jgi:hypothetical protein
MSGLNVEKRCFARRCATISEESWCVNGRVERERERRREKVDRSKEEQLAGRRNRCKGQRATRVTGSAGEYEQARESAFVRESNKSIRRLKWFRLAACREQSDATKAEIGEREKEREIHSGTGA